MNKKRRKPAVKRTMREEALWAYRDTLPMDHPERDNLHYLTKMVDEMVEGTREALGISHDGQRSESCASSAPSKPVSKQPSRLQRKAVAGKKKAARKSAQRS